MMLTHVFSNTSEKKTLILILRFIQGQFNLNPKAVSIENLF